jgi:hypothetical protein
MTTKPPAAPATQDYEASQIKRRRATKADMAERKQALVEIVREMRPCTVRQVFYQATVRGIIEKTEGGYDKTQRALSDLRRDGIVPWSSIVDNTRWKRKPRTWDRMQDAVLHTASTYRRSLWADSDAYVEVWWRRTRSPG